VTDLNLKTMKASDEATSQAPKWLKIMDDAVICPYCKTIVIPADAAEAETEVINPCKHVVLQHLWGSDDADIHSAEIKSWRIEASKRHDYDEASEAIYRVCPFIDYLIEHTLVGGGPCPDFTVSIGFRRMK
jgi:hypothetical protein